MVLYVNKLLCITERSLVFNLKFCYAKLVLELTLTPKTLKLTQKFQNKCIFVRN